MCVCVCGASVAWWVQEDSPRPLSVLNIMTYGTSCMNLRHTRRQVVCYMLSLADVSLLSICDYNV